ncbi:ATP-binding cassette domain-containing protein [Algicella marina]|uniref:ATP-binding cassette domain-containing protein n=1 Tax=Algicella marina TaxID=2683284 RepID=A0A6P1T3G0_9RHOB|nr:ATP-binding cassette domain-containing protein [Algicella marina]
MVRGDFRLLADIDVQSKSRVAVIGPSGGGKSTLLNTVAGFLQPASGRIEIAGEDVTQAAPAARNLTMVFQDNNLFPHLTLAQNTGLGIAPNLRLNAAQKDRVSAVLARVGLEGKEASLPPDLSGGQQSRAALARALLRGRPLLLLDEPFAALGPALRLEMLDLVAEICAEEAITLLMITHAPEDALRICPQTLLVADGTVEGPQDTGALLADPPESLRSYLGAR